MNSAYHFNLSSKAVVTTRFTSTYYTPAHEYIRVDGDVGTVGITDYAQASLGDIVFVDLPEVDEEFDKGEAFGSVESVKAASDVYLPVAGTILEVNDNITDDPSLVNGFAEEDAWFVKVGISDDSEISELMDADAYEAHCDAEDH